MKKTVTVNLGGFVFHIDEDACIRLESYLKRVEAGMGSPEEAKEVMHDIELRLSELFKERLGAGRQVINMDDVSYVIGVMGEPEDINDKTGSGATAPGGKGFGKRMYRDPDNRVLGGVCSGLAAYLGIDPVVVRIVMVLTFFAFGPLLYIVLWIAMPEAKNAAQKLEMRGETVNAENIKKNIRDEYEKVKTSLNSNKTKRDVEDTFREIFTVLGRVILVFVKVIVWIVGISLILAGLALLLSFTDVFLFNGWQTGLDGLSSFMLMFINPAVFNLMVIALFLLIGIPVIAIVMGLFRMVTGMKVNRYLSSGLGIAWMAGVIMMAILVVSQVSNYRHEGNRTDVVKLDSTQAGLITIKTTDSSVCNDEWECDSNPYFWSVNSNDDFNGLYTLTELSLYPAEDSVGVIKTELSARGRSKGKATSAIDTSVVLYEVQDSVIAVTPGMLVPKDKEFRFQRNRLKMYLPVGSRIFISPDAARILKNAENLSYLDTDDMGGKTWVMTGKGLKLEE